MDTFANLLIQNIPHLRRYARSLTRDVQQAEDLVQGCLDRAWSRMSQWQTDTNMRAWLFTIMHNLHVNTLRHNGGYPTSEYMDGMAPGDKHQSDIEGVMEVRDLEKALGQLSVAQREVLMLVCVEGMSYAQVSAVLGIPAGTVMSRLHRAREAMRVWMRGDDATRLRRVK